MEQPMVAESLADASDAAHPPRAAATAAVFRVLKDSLDSPEQQVRRNATTGLAVLATPECAELLSELAILDPDPGVRQRATAELERLDPTARQAAAVRATAWLVNPALPERSVEDEPGVAAAAKFAMCGRANDLLVALRKQGITSALPPSTLPPRWAQLGRAPVLQRALRAWTYLPLFFRIRRYLLQQQPLPPLWWSLVLAWLGALPGAILTALAFWFKEPQLGEHVYLAICLPAAALATLTVAAVNRTAVPVERYCHFRMGALVETLGLLWRPLGKLWVVVPLLAVALAGAALLPLLIGFGGLGSKLFDHLAWILLSFLGQMGLYMAMRALAVTAPWLGFSATLGSGLVGLLFGLLAPLALMHFWPIPAVAVLASESLLVVLSIAMAFTLSQRLPQSVVQRPPSRSSVGILIALSLVVSPGLWLRFNPLQLPRAGEQQTLLQAWWLAQVPVERSFRVDFPQRVRAHLEPTDPNFEVRCWRNHEEMTIAPDEFAWILDPGIYRLEITVAEAQTNQVKFSYWVREGYLSAVGLLARKLLLWQDQPVPHQLVGAFRLELILNADAEARGGTTWSDNE